ncbi:hypothetical protein NE237_018932 [Protea cynaroides]|uniref:Uncharacterized protein n=1 Tax=Protea cynaroides TaxID=273540 RepID=A0A9Q0KAS8_9MAGN|nr:hypothetical protein NE237_018932 [Protea cynaroides]
MRMISDMLVSNWNYVWAVNVVVLKSLELVGVLSPFRCGGFSTLALFIVSAASSFFLLLLALLLDLMEFFRHHSITTASWKRCRGGICWHGIHNRHLVDF